MGDPDETAITGKGDNMQETDLVLKLIEELSRRECNGHARVRLGTALADPDKFKDIFSQYSRGTYFENIDLELDEVYPEIQCSCGYHDSAPSPDMLSSCPQCGGTPELSSGTEFEIMEPDQ